MMVATDPAATDIALAIGRGHTTIRKPPMNGINIAVKASAEIPKIVIILLPYLL